MARSEYNIPNQSGSGFRSDLNIALAAIRTNNSGAGAPTNQFDYMQYVEDTVSDPNVDVVYQRGRTSTFYRLYKIGGPHYFQDGTAAAPSLTFDSDVDTGISRPAANTLAFSTAGSEAVRIDSSGNVGINTTSANAPLHVKKSSQGLIQTWEADLGTNVRTCSLLSPESDSATEPFIFSTNNSWRFRVDTTEALTIDAGGRVGIGQTSPAYELDVAGDISYEQEGAAAFVVGTTAASNSLGSQVVLKKSRGTLSSPATVVADDDLGKIVFKGYTEDGVYHTGYQIKAVANTQTTGNSEVENRLSIVNGGVERLKLGNDGLFTCLGIYSNTTSNSADVHVTSAGVLLRSTSSGKYKTSVETLEDSYADALLNCRPVWYRSLCPADNSEHSWWGFIAEEVAQIDPRLVNYKTVEVTHDANEKAIETPCTPEPESVMYDRFVPHLLNLIKRQKAAIEALEARVTALENV